jgi:hypothetical protein
MSAWIKRRLKTPHLQDAVDAVNVNEGTAKMSDGTPLTVPGGAASSEPLINCVMLMTWPRRRDMVHEAIASFACQDYAHRTLTIVNDGEPCHLSPAFRASFDGRIIQLPSRTSLGDKRNQAVAAVPGASFSASFDDDDFSLPHRLSANLHAMQSSSACWLSASRKFIAIGSIDNIVGFECGRCYGAGMVSASVTRQLQWPSMDCFEDQRLFELVRDHVRRPPASPRTACFT